MAKILITTGGTREHIDPVRYITNASSGLQGFLLAIHAAEKGHDVVLISAGHPGGNPYVNMKIINVVSADDMYEAAVKEFPSCDVAICAAAVGDYKVANIATEKIKRTGDSVILELIPNKDIAKELGAMKQPNQTLVGFALETSNGFENAMAKIKKKNLDFVVLNETSAENPAFGVPDNEVKLINSFGSYNHLTKRSKEDIAKRILEALHL